MSETVPVPNFTLYGILMIILGVNCLAPKAHDISRPSRRIGVTAQTETEKVLSLWVLLYEHPRSEDNLLMLNTTHRYLYLTFMMIMRRYGRNKDRQVHNT